MSALARTRDQVILKRSQQFYERGTSFPLKFFCLGVVFRKREIGAEISDAGASGKHFLSIEDSSEVPQVWRLRSEGSWTSHNGSSETF